MVNALRSGEHGLFKDRAAMREYVRERPDSLFGAESGAAVSGFRVDTEEHAFLIRCNPVQGDYNFTATAMFRNFWTGISKMPARESGLLIRIIRSCSAYRMAGRLP